MASENKKNISSRDTFGSRLRKARTERGLSQKELASMLGYNHNGPISTMENDKTVPDLHVIRKLASCLDVDLHWLIMGRRAASTDELLAALEPIIGEHLCSIQRKMAKIHADIISMEIALRLRGVGTQAEIDKAYAEVEALDAEQEKAMKLLEQPRST